MAHPNQQPYQQPTHPFTGQVPGAYHFNHDQQGQPPMYTPQPQAMDADPYRVTAWGQFTDFTCPSGQRCALKPINLEELLTMGVLEDINALTGIVEADVIRPAQGLPPVNTEKLLQNKGRIADVMRVVDQVVLSVVAKPSLTSDRDDSGKKIAEEHREAGRVYIDTVNIGDRIAIFNEALRGVKDLESFRAAADQPGGSVAGQQGGALPTEPGVRHP